MTEGNGVTYGFKELLEQINVKVDRIDQNLEKKADVSVVTALQAQLEVVVREQYAAQNQRDSLRRDIDHARTGVHDVRNDLVRVSGATEALKAVETYKRFIIAGPVIGGIGLLVAIFAFIQG